MENTNVQEVKMPITYDDLKKSLVDSGRPYDFAMIDRAYALAEKAHGEQRRRSGEPYICHPLSVAQILVELGMDSESIAAALMHDVAEDTPVTVAEIKQKTAYEILFSDWSSDVCSSDLPSRTWPVRRCCKSWRSWQNRHERPTECPKKRCARQIENGEGNGLWKTQTCKK